MEAWRDLGLLREVAYGVYLVMDVCLVNGYSINQLMAGRITGDLDAPRTKKKKNSAHYFE